MTTTRCAIYTRKSNEEGLDQAFNSLDAQREAGLDYIKSQRHEGWESIPDKYDDGGYSGGTMKRPGLEKLLDDIDRGRIDVVVVYKVDRLSRSLGDFARMMQLFDEKKVSFVSVTQQFNTTTSMGRLTLNMLLSFAQFEREVSGERIRDKIAATKRKGYWVGGRPPLGYRLQREDEERGLYIVPEEADQVRAMFQRFTKAKSFVGVAESLNKDGFTTKRWASASCRMQGGKPITQKYLHRVLTNPLYIGKITHTRAGNTEVHDGLHDPIIDRELWDRAHSLIQSQDRTTLHRWTHSHLLKGKIRTVGGAAMSPSSTHRPLTKRGTTSKSNQQKRLVPYYVSQQAIKHGFASCPIKTINAEHLDDLVSVVVLDHLGHEILNHQPIEKRNHWIRSVIDGVTLAPDQITIRLDTAAIKDLETYDFEQLDNEAIHRPTCPYQPEIEDRGRLVHLILKIQIKKLDGRRIILSPDGHDLIIPSTPKPKQHIVDAIGLAYRWHDEITKSKDHLRIYAETHSIAPSRIRKLLPLTLLSPEILKRALTGTLPERVTLKDLRTAGRQLDWNLQAAELGIADAPATTVSP